MFKNHVFAIFVFFPKNMELKLHFGMFTSGILPLDQKINPLEILSIIFPKQLDQPYFENLSFIVALSLFKNVRWFSLSFVRESRTMGGAAE